MDEIIADKTTFERLNGDTEKRENQVKSLLKSLKSSESINEATYNDVYKTGLSICKLCGLPKYRNLKTFLDQSFRLITTQNIYILYRSNDRNFIFIYIV